MNKEFDIDNIDFTKIIEIKNKYKCDNNYVEVDIALCNYEPEDKSYRIIIAYFCTLNEIKICKFDINNYNFYDNSYVKWQDLDYEVKKQLLINLIGRVERINEKMYHKQLNFTKEFLESDLYFKLKLLGGN